MDFTADSKGLFVNSMTNGGGTLLYIDSAGKAHSLLKQQSVNVSWGIPSRDGRRLTMLGQAFSANLWMLQDF